MPDDLTEQAVPLETACLIRPLDCTPDVTSTTRTVLTPVGPQPAFGGSAPSHLPALTRSGVYLHLARVASALLVLHLCELSEEDNHAERPR
jgi:hypothetical protein